MFYMDLLQKVNMKSLLISSFLQMKKCRLRISYFTRVEKAGGSMARTQSDLLSLTPLLGLQSSSCAFRPGAHPLSSPLPCLFTPCFVVTMGHCLTSCLLSASGVCICLCPHPVYDNASATVRASLVTGDEFLQGTVHILS